jgi:hypothetical protein
MMRSIRFSPTDLVTSVLLLGTAGYFATSAWRNLKIGSPGAMGPGYFPLLIASGMVLVALVIGVRAFRHDAGLGRIAGPRAIGLILGGPAIFAVMINPLGFIPAIATSTFVACWSSRQMTWRFALLITAMLTGLATGVFVYMLKMPVTLFGAWAGI